MGQEFSDTTRTLQGVPLLKSLLAPRSRLFAVNQINADQYF